MKIFPTIIPTTCRWPTSSFPDRLFIFDNIRHTLTLVAYAFLNGKDPENTYEEALRSLGAMQDLLAQPLSEPVMLPQGPYRLEPRVDPEAFRSQVARIKDYITAGDIIQAVFSQPFGCSPPPDPWWLYRVQRYINPSPYLYFMHLDNTVLVGSSPETMVRLDSGVATLRPIAGTKPRGKTEQEDRQLADELLQDPKERAEHLMLVDLGRNDLGRVAEIGTVQVTDLMIVERYSHVMHLVSNISCDLLSGCDAFDLLRATFPAGTLSGAPKIRAMEIIAELEQEPRGPYGGALGYISFTGNMDLAITIRTATIQNGTLTVQAGAGIVADSDPERERLETIEQSKGDAESPGTGASGGWVLALGSWFLVLAFLVLGSWFLVLGCWLLVSNCLKTNVTANRSVGWAVPTYSRSMWAQPTLQNGIFIFGRSHSG